MAVDGEHVYWTNYGTARSAGRTSTAPASNQSFITGATVPYGVAVDGEHVYWANYGSGTIGRANLDGTGVNQSFITGATRPRGVAVDGQHVYWANYGRNTIGRANLDGTGVNQSFITGANVPYGVAVTAGPTEPDRPTGPTGATGATGPRSHGPDRSKDPPARPESPDRRELPARPGHWSDRGHGPTGATGATGTNGTNGSTGATGPGGVPGAVGATGPTGVPGSPGNAGIAYFASFNGVPSGSCLAFSPKGGNGNGGCVTKPSATVSGFTANTVFAVVPAGGATVSDLYAATSAKVKESDTVNVRVIDATTFTTLLQCQVTSITKNFCSNSNTGGFAAAGHDLEVLLEIAGSSGNKKEWEVTFRY